MLTTNMRLLLSHVADGNMKFARKYAMIICESEKAEKNQRFCEDVIKKIQLNSLNMLELPNNVSNLLIQEDVQRTFFPERYYLSEENKALVQKISDVHHVSDQLAKAGITYLNSALLHGVSGTGKSMLARYVAHTLNLPFVYANLTRVITSHLGSSAKNLGEIFDFVADKPCVLFLDELDAISSVRSSSGEQGVSAEMSRVTTGLMQCLDRVSGDVIILAATNRLNLIDTAVQRRFRIHHEVHLLTTEELFLVAQRFLDDAIKKGELNVRYHSSSLKNWISSLPANTSPAYVTDHLVQLLAEALSTASGEIQFPKK